MSILRSVRWELSRAISLITMPVFRALDVAALNRLTAEDPLGGQLASAIRNTIDKRHTDQRIAEIEALRERMSKMHSPLADGSLGQPGIYDRNETISSACSRSKPPIAALLLYNLARICQPKCILELGTNLGISAAYLRAGQHGGSLITLEASAYRLALARDLHTKLGFDGIQYVEGMFADTLEQALVGRQIDMAFIDGHHHYRPTLDYFKSIRQRAAPRCIFIFDDIRWSAGMKRAWNKLQSQCGFSIVIDLESIGVCAGNGRFVPYRTPVLRSILCSPPRLFDFSRQR